MVGKKASARILIYHQGVDTYFILGAGEKYLDHSDDFNWMDVWKVFRKTRVYYSVDNEPGQFLKKTLKLQAPGIHVSKYEQGGGGIIFWCDGQYHFIQFAG